MTDSIGTGQAGTAGWRAALSFDPLPPLLSSGNAAVAYWVRRDLLGLDAGPVDALWQLPAVKRILGRQQADGAWPRAGERTHEAINYGLIETWRHFRFLVEQFGLTRRHPQAERAAEFLFSCQTQEGDIRGFLANQYATYYTGAILALLVKAGYGDDARVEKCFQWLLDMRQDDGGWTVPLQTHKLDRATQYRLTSETAEPLEPDRARPFSHNCTGMVLRAFAVHPRYRSLEAAQAAARLYKARFFRPDSYTSYEAASYWVRFEYPFWWNNLVAGLDSLSRMGFSRDDEHIGPALGWLADHQERGGLWRVSYVEPLKAEKETPQARDMKLWVSLAVCRVFSRLFAAAPPA